MSGDGGQANGADSELPYGTGPWVPSTDKNGPGSYLGQQRQARRMRGQGRLGFEPGKVGPGRTVIAIAVWSTVGVVVAVKAAHNHAWVLVVVVGILVLLAGFTALHRLLGRSASWWWSRPLRAFQAASSSWQVFGPGYARPQRWRPPLTGVPPGATLLQTGGTPVPTRLQGQHTLEGAAAWAPFVKDLAAALTPVLGAGYSAQATGLVISLTSPVDHQQVNLTSQLMPKALPPATWQPQTAVRVTPVPRLSDSSRAISACGHLSDETQRYMARHAGLSWPRPASAGGPPPHVEPYTRHQGETVIAGWRDAFGTIVELAAVTWVVAPATALPVDGYAAAGGQTAEEGYGAAGGSGASGAGYDAAGGSTAASAPPPAQSDPWA